MAKIRKLYDEAIKPDGSKQVIYPITSTRAVYTTYNVTVDALLNEGYRFGGVVGTSDTPTVITGQRAFYAATQPGTYGAFGGLEVEADEITFLLFDGSNWSKQIYIKAINTEKLADSAITTPKLADEAVTTAKIADSNVITTKIADSAVTTPKIADSNITTAKIQDENVTTPKIADSAITTEKIKNSNVSWEKLDDNVQNLVVTGGGQHGTPFATEFGDSDEIGITQKTLTEDHISVDGRLTNLETQVGEGGTVDSRIAAAKSEIIGDADLDYNTLGKVEDKIQTETTRAEEAETGLDHRLEVVEQLAVISAGGGDISIATPQDFNNPTAEQRAKVPTVGAMLDGYVTVSQNTETGHTDINVGGVTTPVASVEEVSQLGQQVIYDVTKNNPTAGPNNDGKFESLSALLSDANLSTLIPIAVRCGGMSIRFIQTSDNMYVQYRLMSQTFSNNEVDWQGVEQISGVNVWYKLAVPQWKNAIKELYILPEYFIDGDHYEVTTNSSTLFIQSIHGNVLSWTGTCTPNRNNSIIDIVCEGNVVGKIIFNDFQAMQTNTSQLRDNWLSNIFISSHSLNPEITIMPEFREDILRVPIFFKSLDKEQWKDAIKELYVLPEYFNDAYEYQVTSNSTTFVLQAVNGTLLVFDARINPTENNKILDIKILNTETVVAKVIFKDYQAFLTNTSVTSNNKLNNFVIRNESFAPSILLENNEITATNYAKDDSVFQAINIAESFRELYDGNLLLAKCDYSAIGIGAAYDANTISVINDITRFIGKSFKLSVSSITSTGNIESSMVYLEFLNGESLVSYSSFCHGGETISGIIPSNITKALLRAFNSVSNISTEGATYYFNGIEVKLTDEITIDIPDVCLPSIIYGKKDESIQLFKRGIVKTIDPYNYFHNVRIAGNILYQDCGRYFDITPLESGNKQLSYTLYDDRFKRGITKNVNIHSVDTVNSPVSQKNVLCLGSSTTVDGVWANELKRRLTGDGGTPAGLGLSNLNFVGRISGASGVKVEAISGWSFRTYMQGVSGLKFTLSGTPTLHVGSIYKFTNSQSQEVLIDIEENDFDNDGTITSIYRPGSSITGIPSSQSGTLTKVSGDVRDSETISFIAFEQVTYSPFLYNGVFTFSHYAQKYCGGSIDIMPNLLTCLNYDVIGDDDLTSVMNDVKAFVDKLHSEFPNCKVILSPGVGANYKGWNSGENMWYGVVLIEQRFMEELDEFVNSNDYDSFCYLPDTLAEMDMDYNFPLTQQAVNQRVTTIMEYVGTNGVHPSYAGSLATADSFYRCLINTCL